MEKYLFVVPSFGSGGAERAVANLSSELARQGENVTVVIYFSVPDTYAVDPGVKVINLSQGDEAVYNALTYTRKLGILRKILYREDPDYILPFLPQVTIHAELAAGKLRSRIIHTLRNNPALTPENPIKRIVCNRIICHSRKTIVQNEAQKRFFPEKYQDKIHVLFNPVSPEMLQAERKTHDGALTVIGVGRLNHQKNFPLLLRAMKLVHEKHPEVRLEIYGKGELQEELETQIEQLGLRNTAFLMGRSSHMKEVYQNADLFVLSSDFEGMPNTLIEAMAMGLPCIATDCKTGPSDLINNGENGLLVPVGQEKPMAQAMLTVIENPDLAEKFRMCAREKILNTCTVQAIVCKLKEICRN